MSISLDDLWDTCKACGGSGRHDPRTVRGGALSAAPPLCNECRGRGGKPTPSGQAVLDFLKRATQPGLTPDPAADPTPPQGKAGGG
jgi:Tryptophan RNA-binding attenuator protein inhibitory protein